MAAGGRTRRRRRGAFPELRLWLALTLILGSALPSDAELVVFSGGHVLKVDGVSLRDDAMRLLLESGGMLTVPLIAIERIISDEILAEPEPVPVAHPRLEFSETAAVPESPFGELIYDAARRHGLSPDLIAAMVRAESAFDPEAISHKGARGLMQLMPATARRFGVPAEALFDPKRNLEAGLSYLKWLSERYPEEPVLILAAYNAGEGNVDRYGGVPPFRETRDYIRRIYSSLGLESDDALTVTR